MQLSKNFSLNELTKSQTAIRLGITNIPSSQEIFNLKNLCENVLQRVRDRFKAVSYTHLRAHETV